MKKRFFYTLVSSILAISWALCGNVSALVDTPWGPARDTYTWSNPADKAVFNSITDNPQIGDERNFVRVWEVQDGEDERGALELAKLRNEINLEVGKTYGIYIYYHNNADAHEVGQSEIGIAEEVRVKSSFPATIRAGERGTVTGTITAKDTEPLSVWDGVYLKSERDVYLRYVTGTSVIHNGGALNGTAIGSDYLFGDGALLGYNKLSGILPGCNQYAGYITYWIHVDAPDFEIKKSIVTEQDVYNNGDKITFKVRYENTGTMDQNNVVIRDILPSGLTYVAGSARLYNNNLTDGKQVNDDLVNENGMNIGDYAGGSGWAELTYDAIIDDDAKCGSRLKNDVLVSTNDGNKHDSVTIVVGEGCATPPEEESPEEPGEELPENPEELPQTGPVEIILASLIVIGIIGGGYYLYRTRKTLKKVESIAKGEEKFAENNKKPADTQDGGSQKPDNMVE